MAVMNIHAATTEVGAAKAAAAIFHPGLDMGDTVKYALENKVRQLRTPAGWTHPIPPPLPFNFDPMHLIMGAYYGTLTEAPPTAVAVAAAIGPNPGPPTAIRRGRRRQTGTGTGSGVVTGFGGQRNANLGMQQRLSNMQFQLGNGASVGGGFTTGSYQPTTQNWIEALSAFNAGWK